MTDQSGSSWLARDRYGLLRFLADSNPVSVQPAASLAEARERLKILNGENGGGWHIFDLLENKRVE